MTDLWTQWEARMERTGRPDRAATELTDVEIIRLLGEPVAPDRHQVRQILQDELLRRLTRTRDQALDPAPPHTREQERYGRPPG